MPRQRNRSLARSRRPERRRNRTAILPQAAPSPAPPVGSGRLLTVEDNRTGRRRLAELLAARGIQVDVTGTAEGAIRRLETIGYDGVFLDLNFPRINGLELLSQLLRLRPDLSVVAVAGVEDGDAATQALKRGAIHTLTTPVDARMLEVVLRSCQERARLLQQSAFLQQQTIMDDLTTAFNRRHLDNYLEEELERDRRYGRTFSILFFDLDRLKDVNDRYGHLAGSRVLREVATLIQGKLRKSDRIFRYGGDEFVVTLPETGADGALRVAHRLRRAVRSHRFLGAEGLAVTLTASFGIATFPQDGSSQEEMIRVADQAMYRIKDKTRDGVGTREAPA
ncbi:MAG: diguanylate cyclase [Candidatus Methylomirabilota bacterium]